MELLARHIVAMENQQLARKMTSLRVTKRSLLHLPGSPWIYQATLAECALQTVSRYRHRSCDRL